MRHDSPAEPAHLASVVAALAAELAAITTRPWTLMEVCGGQTHAIVRWGLDQLLPPGVRLIHGPGCPVCVTPASTIEAALALARRPHVILASYGDMLRVPGREAGDDLLGVRAAGGDVRLLTSPLEALDLAEAHPQRQVVFLAVGFETTAPATALLARQVRQRGVGNLSLLVAHVRVVPAMDALLDDRGADADAAGGVQGFLAAGHVAAVMGTAELEGLVRRHRLPVVVTGFEPVDLLEGVLACVRALERGEPGLQNAYGRVVRSGGNAAARALLAEVFEPVDLPWRGLGVIPGGGLALAPAWSQLDARRRFGLQEVGAARVVGDGGDAAAGALQELVADPPADAEGDARCIAGTILRGRATPADCPAFGGPCTPEHPLGAPMVSGEGACAAWYRYRPVALARHGSA
ncbi:MAG: hydrogenase formation protein HypD [Cyanobacteriota bacterium]|nr:hydrogenase formation protein HypD [Cyanobacteriota bacterium]